MAYRAEPEGVIAVVEAPRRELPRDGTPLPRRRRDREAGQPRRDGAHRRRPPAPTRSSSPTAAADPWNPNAIRASTGAVFTLPVVEATPRRRRRLSASSSSRPSSARPRRYTDADLTRPVAIAVGAEDEGLAASWLEAADRRVSIPVARGSADSLNAATAAAILLFEAVRQRG